jgi:hypothetical protein
MFDSLRDSGMEEEAAPEPVVETTPTTGKAPFLGMTAGQRLVIAILILLMVCVLGVFILLLTQKIYLPFF